MEINRKNPFHFNPLKDFKVPTPRDVPPASAPATAAPISTAIPPLEDNPEAKARYDELMQETTAILAQTSFTEKDSKKLQSNLKELNQLQSELKAATTQSLRALNEMLAAAYSTVTGEDLQANDFYLSAEQLEKTVKTPVTLPNQYQPSTVNAEAQKMIDDGMMGDLQNQINNTQKMVDELNARIANLNQLFGPGGEGNEASQEIQELKNQIASLQAQSQALNEQLQAAEAKIAAQQNIIAILEKVSQILIGKTPPANSQEAVDQFNAIMKSRDQLSALLSTLDKNDPNYALVEQSLNSVLTSYSFEKYPVGTVASLQVETYTYSKKSDFDALIAGAYYKSQFTPAFIANFIKFINGDPKATYPVLNGAPMDANMIEMGKTMYFDATPAKTKTLIIKPNGEITDGTSAQASLIELKNGTALATITDGINTSKSIIAGSQNEMIKTQIANNQKEIAAKEQVLKELLDAQTTKLNELMKNNQELKEVMDRLTGIITPDADPSTTFSLSRLIACLIDLCQVMQKMASAETARLSIVTKKMSAYSKLLLQVPLLSSEDTKDKDKYNPLFTNAQEGIRINKGAEEDLAKQIQALLQSLKDASQSIEDFIGTILNMMASISQKISR